jgi:hypothetical protein
VKGIFKNGGPGLQGQMLQEEYTWDKLIGKEKKKNPVR